MKPSVVVGMSAWAMILLIIIMVVLGEVRFNFETMFFFIFLCVVGFVAAIHADKKK